MFLEYLKVFGLIYIVSIGGMFYLSSKTSGPIVLPGDIYFRKGPRMVYFPLGGSLLLAIVLFLLFKNFIGLVKPKTEEPPLSNIDFVQQEV